MTAWQPHSEAPDGESPAYWDLGGHRDETIVRADHIDEVEAAHTTQTLPAHHSHASKSRDGDSALDPYWTVTQDHYSPAQRIERRVRAHAGAEMVKAAHRARLAEVAAQQAHVTEVTPQELAQQHSDVEDSWREIEESLGDDTVDYTGPVDYRFFKRPDER